MLSRFSYNEVAVLQLNNLLFAFCFALQTVFAVVLRTCLGYVLGIQRIKTAQTIIGSLRMGFHQAVYNL